MTSATTMRADTAGMRAIRRIGPGELQALRGVLEESGRELVGRVRVGGVTYSIRAVRRGLREWALHLTPEAP